MQYPSFLKEKDIIGITAPSAGVGDDIPSFEKSLTTLKNHGYKIKETTSTRNKGFVSTTSKKRAQELDELITDKNVKLIICASGGDFLIDMLPFIDWNHIKENPKWIMGYSDPTYLLYITTTKLDIATIYGCNAGSFDQTNIHECLKNNLEISENEVIKISIKENIGLESLKQKIIEIFNLEQIETNDLTYNVSATSQTVKLPELTRTSYEFLGYTIINNTLNFNY